MSATELHVVNDDASSDLPALAREIHAQYERGRKSHDETIEAYFTIGRCLKRAREQFPSNNDFGHWCDEQSFPFKREWARQLRTAAEHEDGVRAALATQVANDDGQPNLRKALAAVRESAPPKPKERNWSQGMSRWISVSPETWAGFRETAEQRGESAGAALSRLVEREATVPHPISDEERGATVAPVADACGTDNSFNEAITTVDDWLRKLVVNVSNGDERNVLARLLKKHLNRLATGR